MSISPRVSPLEQAVTVPEGTTATFVVDMTHTKAEVPLQVVDGKLQFDLQQFSRHQLLNVCLLRLT